MWRVKEDSRGEMEPGTFDGPPDCMIVAGLVANSDTGDPCRIYRRAAVDFIHFLPQHW
jgi:hypothetical protein